MLHISKIIRKGKEFNLIASGALAFKIYNKVLKDPVFENLKFKNYSLLCDGMDNHPIFQSDPDTRKVYFAIVSDLEKDSNDALCLKMLTERQKNSYAVCQVVAMHYNERYFRAVKKMRNSFDELMELNKPGINQSQNMLYSEQQSCLLTEYSMTMAKVMFHTTLEDFNPGRVLKFENQHNEAA
ncbi:hypothetical protein [Adhaeribacter soli]|uniref:Uncharacterized protein n=1 Tax=Adhaeribacter soli TaxID=2607655 RepID=A0A5N1JAM4_9BACT|nr:hypothetical protein [Adhaeribacter soli]KAA9346068.1 hypothetical protein F0P94_03020 [Adhaeribacter soli]